MQKLCVFSLILIGICTSPAQPIPQVAADAVFDRLVLDYVRGYLGWRPGLAVSLGMHEYDGQLTDFSYVSIEAERARLKAFDRRLENFETIHLGPQAYYDYSILRASVRQELFEFDAMRAYSRNPMTYADALDVNTYIKRDFAPLAQRTRSIISILYQAPMVMAAARTNLDEALPRPYVETAIRTAEGSVAFLEKDLLDALKDLKEEPLRREFTNANARAIAELRRYVAFLKNEKLPKAKDDFAVGREKYAQMLRDTEMVPLTPERILEVGMKELRREQQLFVDTAGKIDPGKKPIEVFRDIQREHPAADALISDSKKDLDTIRQFVLDHHIITIPSEVRPRVDETPSFARATSFASMDTPGPFETNATEAYYYITPVDKDWSAQQRDQWLTAFNYYTTDIVSIHEVYPGHYVQFLCLNSSSAPRLEKMIGSYAFIEGWAHYTEQMMLDQGFGAGGSNDAVKAAKYRLAQLDEALLRLCRLCVSVKMHCQKMTVAEATKFFQDNCFYEEEPAREEATRGTFDPGYLNYTLGKLMILKLRNDYQSEQGEAYSLEKFHNEFLSHGMPPIPLLRQLLLKNTAIWNDIL